MKTHRIAQGMILLVAGLVFGTVGIMIFLAAQDQTRLAEQSFNRADEACRDAASSFTRSLGQIKEVAGGQALEISLRTVPDKRMALADSSSLISACPTRALEFFCLGPGCGHPDNRPVSAGRQNSTLTMRLALRPEVSMESVAKITASTVPAPVPSPVSVSQVPGRPPTPQVARPPVQPARQPLPQQQSRPSEQAPPHPLNGAVPK